MKYGLLFLSSLALYVVSCSPSRQINRTLKSNLLSDEALQTAHVGISIYEPATAKYWFNYQGDNYFVPASNTKLPVCYAAMKYLGDSVAGLEYYVDDSFLVFRGTGDPTLLHPDFPNQVIVNFLGRGKKKLAVTEGNFTASRWGSGWGIGDISESYAPERSELPVYGNVVRVFKKGDSIATLPRVDHRQISNGSLTGWNVRFERASLSENIFTSVPASRNFTPQEIPFVTGSYRSARVFLMDTLKRNIELRQRPFDPNIRWTKIYSQPTDSVLRPLMHRSDNFFAEQSLLMVSNRLLGEMNDARIIDTLLKMDFKDLPQKPRWVDGSGLSRYNLFTPEDFVFILNKMKTGFGMDRLKIILPTGNEGTLAGRFVADSNFIFAKTGTLSGVVALSGFLYTRQDRLLIFSVLVNNHNASATQVRKAVEKFIHGIRQRY